MAKSVLVIEKPECCDACDLYMNQVCSFLRKPIVTDKIYQIDDECPLKDLPKSRPCNYYDFEHYTSGYDKGWNDFRDAIYKDNEKEDQSYECNDREL